MDDTFYQYVINQTDGFVFSDTNPHVDRVCRLVTQVRKMAIAYHYKTPMGFNKDFDQDDWIQLAMITLFECITNYDRKRPFDHFVRFKVPRRLEDQRRKLYRQNPKTQSDNPGDQKWFFNELNESTEREARTDEKLEPEKQYLLEEARQTLLTCIQHLGKTGRMLFAKHEFEKVSFRKLYKLVPDFKKSFATFKRVYQTDIFERVKSCVQSNLKDK